MKSHVPTRIFSNLLVLQLSPLSAAFLKLTGTPKLVPWRLNNNLSFYHQSKRAVSSSLMEPSPPDEDQSKWEKMYADNNFDNVIDQGTDVAATEIRVITFDLDNTLWKTSKVIGAANDALGDYLNEMSIEQPKRAEVVMGELFKKNKAKYAPILEDATVSEKDVAPVYLTQLRKDAVNLICKEHNGYSDADAEIFANEAFNVWTNARHAAIPLNFATSVISYMNQIREMKTSSGCPVIVGAITDGNSNPLIVPELENYFDFCVNAESVGISKPDRKIYETAVDIVAKMDSVDDIFGEIVNNGKELTKDMIEDLVGPWWVHIGDHFMKDIVAAKGMNMRTIWARELVLPKVSQESMDKTNTEKDADKKSVDDFVKEVSKMEVIQMSIGAEDFLVHSMEKEFADEVVYEFNGIYEALTKWHNEAHSNDGATTTKTVPDIEVNDILTLVMPNEVTKSPSQEDTLAISADSVAQMKFCMYCGTKLPSKANFCSSCGNKQPEL